MIKYPKGVEEHYENILRYHEVLGRDAEKKRTVKAWKKALKNRNGGASGLQKVIEAFDEFITSF